MRKRRGEIWRTRCRKPSTWRSLAADRLAAMPEVYHALGLHMHQPPGNLVALHNSGERWGQVHTRSSRRKEAHSILHGGSQTLLASAATAQRGVAREYSENSHPSPRPGGEGESHSASFEYQRRSCSSARCIRTPSRSCVRFRALVHAPPGCIRSREPFPARPACRRAASLPRAATASNRIARAILNRG